MRQDGDRFNAAFDAVRDVIHARWKECLEDGADEELLFEGIRGLLSGEWMCLAGPIDDFEAWAIEICDRYLVTHLFDTLKILVPGEDEKRAAVLHSLATRLANLGRLKVEWAARELQACMKDAHRGWLSSFVPEEHQDRILCATWADLEKRLAESQTKIESGQAFLIRIAWDGPLYDQLMSKLTGEFRRYLLAWGSSKEEAEDLIQGWLLHLHSGNLDKYDPTRGKSFHAWAWTGFKNFRIDRYRENKKKIASEISGLIAEAGCEIEECGPTDGPSRDSHPGLANLAHEELVKDIILGLGAMEEEGAARVWFMFRKFLGMDNLKIRDDVAFSIPLRDAVRNLIDYFPHRLGPDPDMQNVLAAICSGSKGASLQSWAASRSDGAINQAIYRISASLVNETRKKRRGPLWEALQGQMAVCEGELLRVDTTAKTLLLKQGNFGEIEFQYDSITEVPREPKGVPGLSEKVGLPLVVSYMKGKLGKRTAIIVAINETAGMRSSVINGVEEMPDVRS